MPSATLMGVEVDAGGSATTVITIGSGGGTPNPAGAAIELVMSANSTSAAIASITDSLSQTYTLVKSSTGFTNNTFVYQCPNALALASGQTITITWSSGTSVPKHAAAIACTGVTAAPLDSAGAAVGTGTSNAPSQASNTLANAGELCLAIIETTNTAGVVTFGGGWSSPLVSMHAQMWTSVAWQVAPTTSPVTAAGTTTASGAWIAMVVPLVSSGPSAAASASGTGTATAGAGVSIPAAASASGVGTATASGLAVLPVTLANTTEGVPNGTTLSTGNTGGISGNNYDGVFNSSGAGTIAADNSVLIHGQEAIKVSTGGTAVLAQVRWSTQMGTQTGPVWARDYFQFNARPAVLNRLIAYETAGGTNCATAHMNTNGTINIRDSTGTPVLTSTTITPLGQPFRLEIFVIGGATTGQCGFRLFVGANVEGTVPDEAQTSTATQSFTGAPGIYDFGISVNTANVAYWMDDLALSNVGWIGPSGVSAAATLTGRGTATAGASVPVAAAATVHGVGTATAGTGSNVTAAAAASGGGTAYAGFDPAPPQFPPPTVPVFPAGYQPQQADFTAWWYDNLGFFQNKPVFRARQTTTTTTLPTGGTVTTIGYDTVDEDPFDGWNPSTFAWTPPAGYSGWYQVTVTVFTQALAAGDDIRALIAGTYGYDLATVDGPSTHGAGVEGQWTVYLIGGQDTVKGAGSLLGATSPVSTSDAAGQQSGIEILWLSD